MGSVSSGTFAPETNLEAARQCGAGESRGRARPMLVLSSRDPLTIGYFIGAGLMVLGGLTEVVFGVKAERRPLESVARPLTAVDRPHQPLSGGAVS